ncbi:MAG: thioether cross-link-forming SCIFF peptide maturase, partial [Oscillospiraceae bacterium]|nr:thioether cross-link-forming SCIFF peptide maturase [Oscillospiraceae bacterium]
AMPMPDGYSDEQCKSAWAELMTLKAQGLLFSSDDYVDPSMAIVKNAPVKALCLHVSHDCNLRCTYCFASTGDFGTGRKTMPPEIAKKAIDFVIEKSAGRENIEVDFFGGEPLMAMETVRQTVEYARSIEQAHHKHFRFTITTNGVGLNEEIDAYINKEMGNCVLSLDGRKQINDRTRLTRTGAGSYDIIVPKFKKLLETRGDKDYYVRGTFTQANLDFSEDVIHMADLGFDSISVEPVVSAPGTDYELRKEDLPKIFAEYEKLAAEMLRRKDFNFFHFNVDLSQGPCVIKRMRGCGAGCEYVAVTPEGDIYPCHQFVGNPDYLMGNISDGTFDMSISDRFSALNIYTREDCKTCWARFYCSGGCSASNLLVNGDIAKPHFVGCEMERKRLECAIAMKAIEAGMADGCLPE